MAAVALLTHFDGEKILLGEPYKLEPNTPLLVTILPSPTRAGNAEEEEHQDWLRLSLHGLTGAYGDNEPEYSFDNIKEWNLFYEGSPNPHTASS